MKKNLLTRKLPICLFTGFLATFGMVANGLAQTKLFIATDGGEYSWTSGGKTTYTYPSGDVINYLNATDPLADGNFAFVSFEATTNTGAICGEAARRVQVNSFELICNSTSVGKMVISGTSSGTAVRTLRAIYVNGTLVPETDYTVAHSFPTDGSNTSSTCGDITIDGLSVPMGATIKVVIGSSSASTPQNLRVSVIALTADILPVKLVDFNAVSKGNGVEVTWKAANENEGKTYTVERSTSGATFDALTTLPVSGAGSYSYLDNTPKMGGLVFYRLNMLSVDGIKTYSKIKAVNLKGDAAMMIVPNPVVGKDMLATFAPVTENSSVRIINPSGQVLKVQPIGSFTNQATINIDGLKSGLYMLQVMSGKEIQTIRFFKQ